MSEPTELDELLLEPCSPSAAQRRDADALRGGASVNELAATKAAVAALGLADSPEAPPSTLRARVAASVARAGKYGRFVDRLARMFDLSIDEASQLTAKLEDPASWQPFVVPGVDLIPVVPGPRYAGAIASVARLQPGTRFPDHIHRGDETMFVLDGGFCEEGGGDEVWRGDELFRRDGTGHAFVALDGPPCIAASLVTGSVDFT